MSDLHRAVTDEIDAFRPDHTPPFGALMDRNRSRGRRRKMLAVAPVLAAALVASVAWSAVTGGDKLVQQAAAPAAAQGVFGVHPVLDVFRLDGSGEPDQLPEVPAGGLPAWLPEGACSAVPEGRPAAPGTSEEGGLVACALASQTSIEVYLLGPAALTGNDVTQATAVGAPGGDWTVRLELTADGADAHAGLTGEAACAPLGSPQRRLAYVVEGVVVNGEASVAPDVECGVGIVSDTVIIASSVLDEPAARSVARLIAGGPETSDAPTYYTITYLSEVDYREQADAAGACLALPGVSDVTASYSHPPIVGVAVRGTESNDAFRACLAALDGVGVVSGNAPDARTQEPAGPTPTAAAIPSTPTQAADARDFPCTSPQEDALGLVGLSEAAAETKATEQGYMFRVTCRQGAGIPVSLDKSPRRVNVTLVDGQVTAANFG